MKRSFLVYAVFALAAAGLARVSAQAVAETILLNNGSAVTGDIVGVDETSVTVDRRIGAGSARQVIAFSRIEPEALYGLLHRALSPIEGADHMKMADAAFKAQLFDAAARHYDAYGKFAGGATPDLLAKIAESQGNDIQTLIVHARRELARELFSAARKLAMEAMRRYPGHAAATTIPALLEEISRASEEAQRRDAAMLATKKAKAEWERGERALAGVDKWVIKSKDAESTGLLSTAQFNVSKESFENGLRYVRNAEDGIKVLRQAVLPTGLRAERTRLEEEIRTMQIRLRLHVGSLYTVRGAYGTALNFVNAALSFDPTDRDALAARARVEEASALSSSRAFGRASR